MIRKLLLFSLVASTLCAAQSNTLFSAQTFTASAQTGAVIKLNDGTLSASSFSVGTITLTGTSLTTATFAVMASSDNGVTYYALPISPVASPGTTPTSTVTAVANALYQVNLVGITQIKFVTSGTFTGTSVSLVLTASPNGNISRGNSGGSNGGSSKPALPLSPNVIYTLNTATDQGSSTQFTDVSGNSNNATFGPTGCAWTGTGCDFSNSSNSVVSLPASLNADQSYCATVAFRLYGQTGSGGNGSPTFDFFLSSSTINTTGISWLVAGSDQVYTQFSYAGGIQTKSVNAEAGTHVICWVQGLAGNSTNDRFFVDGVENAYSSNGRTGGGQTSGNLVFGRNNFSQPGYFDGILYNFAGWSGQLSTAQVLAASNVLKSTARTYGVQTEPPSSLNQTISFNAIGDSITDGFGATTAWPSALTIVGGYTIVNNGFYGITAQSQLGQARWRDAPRCASGAYKSLVIIFAGTNDVTNGNNGGIVVGYLMANANLLKMAGCQVGIATMISRTGQDANKNLLNGYIRQNAIAGGYLVADFAASPNIGADNAFSNLTYFNADQVHPTQAGQALIAAAASNFINAYGFAAASPSSPNQYSTTTVAMTSSDRNATYTGSGASTWTLPDCLGVTGTEYLIYNNASAAVSLTFQGKASEAITGSATAAQFVTAKFRSTLISPTAAGCGWQRVQ